MAGQTEDTSNLVIERQLEDRLTALGLAAGGDVLAYVGPINYGIEDDIKDAVEKLEGKQERLFVVLETYGGYIEVVERIVHTFRYHYDNVEFIVPNFAMSAGTVLVMSGDAIHMDYSSVLGPIDPQVQRRDTGSFIPALGYLEQFNRLIEKSQEGSLTLAELHYLVKVFNPAELYTYEQARELSITLLKQWLVRYKFRDWTETETRKRKVTKAMRSRRAFEVAKCLNKTGRWHSHSRGINMGVLRKDLKLKIEDFGEDAALNSKIREYYRLLKDYMMRRAHTLALHTSDGYNGL